MKLIVLRGRPHIGKTTTLKIVYERLKRINVGESNYFEYVDDKLCDFRGVLLVDLNRVAGVSCTMPIKVGIVTQGDYVTTKNSIDKHLKKMQVESCAITICACSDKNNEGVNPIDKIKEVQGVDCEILMTKQSEQFAMADEILKKFINLCN